MRKITLVFICLFVAIATSAQINFTTKYTHSENGATITRISIDEPLVLNAEGGYGFRLEAPIKFTSFAFGWDSDNQAAPEGKFLVYYRVCQNGKWSNWKEDHGYHRPETIEPGIFYTDLLFGFNMEDHDSLDFFILPQENADITRIEVVFQNLKTRNLEKDNISVSRQTRDDCLQFPEYIPRSSWCGDYTECQSPSYTPTTITCTHSIIHHGASPDSYTDGATVVRSYWNYHVYSNGWDDIGYNYLLDKFGNMFIGRHNPNLPTTDVKGAHAGNCNSKSIGINFIGNSDAVGTAPTEVQLAKCTDLLAWWYNYNELDPTSSAQIINQAGAFYFDRYRISGHRDVNQDSNGNLGTTCPGATLYAMLPDIRTRVAQRIADCEGGDTIAPTTEITASEKWHNKNFSVGFNDSNSTNAFYQIVDNDNNSWSANTAKGMLYETFAGNQIPENWTITSGTWSMNSGYIAQTDQSINNTNVNAEIAQNNSYNYLYHVMMKISGSTENERAGFNFFSNEDRTNSYMLYLRSHNGHAQLYRYINGSYDTNDATTFVDVDCGIVADTWYDVKITHDTRTGVIKCYINNTLELSLTDDTPLTEGNYISLRTSGCTTEFKNLYILKSRSNSLDFVIGTDIQESEGGNPAAKVRTIVVKTTNNRWSDYAENYLYADITAPTSEIVCSDELDATNNVSFNDDDNNFIAERFYNAKSFDGTRWTSNQNKGFAFNDFDNGIGNEWTSVAGNWSVSGGYLTQTNTSVTSNLYSTVKQDLSDKYMYEFDFCMAGSSTNQRIGLHYMSTEGSTENHGNGYFIYFRKSSSSSRVEFYKVENNVYSQEVCINLPLPLNSWHNVKLIYNRITGTNSIYFDNEYYGSYTDENNFTTGDIVALRNGGGIAYFNNLKIYRSRGESVTINMGNEGEVANIETNTGAAISTILIDSAQNVSAVVCKTFGSTPSDIETSALNDIEIFPNPNNGQFTISTQDHIGEMIYIYNVQGGIILQKKILSGETRININGVASGMYFVKIGSEKRKITIL